MTTRPTSVNATFTPPEWSPAEATDVLEPTAGQKAGGWVVGQAPPAREHNWFWKRAADWITHFATSGARYATLEGATTDTGLAVGDTFQLFEDDTAAVPGAVTATGGAASARDIDVSGKDIATTNNDTHVRIMSRDLTSVVADIATTGGAGTPVRVLTDGTKAWLAYAQIVEQFDIPGASSDWTVDHGGAVHDIAVDDANVYIVGAEGSGNDFARAVTRAAGAAVWAYQHSAAASGGILRSVCTDGRHVFVAGDASSFGSGANLRALIATSGADAANEGGTGSDADAWDAVTTTDVASNRCLACDSGRLFVGMTASPHLEVRAKATGVTVTTLNGTAVSALALDHEYVYAITTSDIVRCFTKPDLAERWQETVGDAVGLASDGAALFSARTAANLAARQARGNAPGWWRIVGDWTTKPFRQLALPFRGV